MDASAIYALAGILNLHSALDEECEYSVDLTLGQWVLLDYACDSGADGLPLDRAGSLLFEERDAVLARLSPMETRSFLYRVRDRRDRRAHAFCTTAKGNAMQAAAYEALSARIGASLGGGQEGMVAAYASSCAEILGVELEGDVFRDAIRFTSRLRSALCAAAESAGISAATWLMLAYSLDKSGLRLDDSRASGMRRSAMLSLAPLCEALGLALLGDSDDEQGLVLYITDEGMNASASAERNLIDLLGASRDEELRAEAFARLAASFSLAAAFRETRFG